MNPRTFYLELGKLTRRRLKGPIRTNLAERIVLNYLQIRRISDDAARQHKNLQALMGFAGAEDSSFELSMSEWHGC
jgi:hypothetical protein